MKPLIFVYFLYFSFNCFGQQQKSSIVGTWETSYIASDVVERKELYAFGEDGVGFFVQFSNSRKYNGIGCRTNLKFNWEISTNNELVIKTDSANCECESYKDKSLKSLNDVEQLYINENSEKIWRGSFKIENNSILHFDNHKFIKSPFIAIDCITENYIYPSIIFSEIHSKSFKPQIFFAFDVTNNLKQLKIEVLENRFLRKKEYILNSGDLGEYYPNLDWKYEELQKIKNPIPITISLNVYLKNKVETISKTFTIRPLNECLLGYDYKGSFVETSKYIGGFINEDSPEVKKFIVESFKLSNIQATGNQLDSHKEVKEQVFALWHNMYKMGFRYSSLTNVSAKGESFNSQYIRSVSETLNEKSGNCIDASVLFASALTRLGIQARILILPTHAIVGYVSYENGEPERNFIELTLLDGSGKKSENSKQTIINSRKFFAKAIEVGNKQYPGDEIVDNSDEVQLYKINKDFRKEISPIPFKLF